MELYNKVSYAISRLITLDYSTSFSGSAKLFPAQMQPHIYAIYGLVRIADEVVDTYRGKDVIQVLNNLESEVYAALERGYSTNPVVQSFVLTAKQYGITSTLIHPFFVSMTMDVRPVEYTKESYKTYIYGSAEVVGLMCLRVFVDGDNVAYYGLKRGAQSLGSAYQKINFMRDMAADFNELGRIYFPGVTFETFGDKAKGKIIDDIEKDFFQAQKSIARLPRGSRWAVELSAVYYGGLLKKLKKTPASLIKQKRIRINGAGKFVLFSRAAIQRRFNHAA